MAENKKNPIIAALCGLFPGGGQFYNGQWGKGILFLFTCWLVVPWLYGIYDAYKTAKEGISPEGKIKKAIERQEEIKAEAIAKIAKKYGKVNIVSPVEFEGGHAGITAKTTGNLFLTKSSLVFQSNNGREMDIPIEKIKKFDVVSDNFTPGVGRTLLMAWGKADLGAQSLRPHNSVLQIAFDTGKREKTLRFDFIAITFAGAVNECQKFNAQLNALM